MSNPNMATRYVNPSERGEHFPFAVKSADPEAKTVVLEYVGVFEVLIPDKTVTYEQLATEWKECPAAAPTESSDSPDDALCLDCNGYGEDRFGTECPHCNGTGLL